MRRRLVLGVLTVLPVLLATMASLGAGTAHAQTEEPTGVITGEITLGTEGATLDAAQLTVDFIILAGEDVSGTITATIEGATFRAEVPLVAENRYIPRAVYQGVSYFGEPTVVTEAQPEAVASIQPVYEATSETPDLSIEQSVTTVIALDRGTGQLGVVRDDLVHNPSDRVYVGGENHVTLRLPTPDNIVDAAGENADGQFTLEEGVLTTTVPLRADASTSIITRYLVTYDVTEDEYLLRVTTPIPANRLVVRVPEMYVDDLEVVGEGVLGLPDVLDVGEGDPVPLRTVVLEDAGPGDSLVVRLEGLALDTNSNPLAETPGSIIAGVVAVLVVGAAGAYAIRRGRSPSAKGTEA